MNTKHFSITEALIWFFHQYQEAYQALQHSDAFRIAEVHSDKQSEALLTIQVIGKSSFFSCKLGEIIENNDFLERFSKKDIAIMAQLAAKTKNMTNYNVISYNFSAESNKTTFSIKKNNKEVITKTAHEIYLDSSLLQKLNQKDALRVGYILASETQLKKTDVSK